MLGIDGRAARIGWTLFLLALLIFTAYAIRQTLMVFTVAVFLAYMLTPLVDIVDRYLPKRIPRTVSLAIVYLVLVGALVAAGISIGSQIGDEAAALAKQLPDRAQNAVATPSKLPLPGWLEPLRGRITGWIQDQYKNGGKDLLPYLEKAGLHVFSGAKYALYVVLVPILAFFFLKDGATMRESFVDGLTEPSRRQILDDILSDINNLLGKYIRALVLLSLCTFTAYSLFLGITGAPYALLLAGVAGLFEFIPVIGPLAAMVVIVTLAGFSGYDHVLWFVIFWGVYRLFQDYVVSPNLMGKGVELNPVLVLFGVLAGEQIGGIAGMFFSVPVIATLRVIYVRLSRARRRRELAPTALVEQ
jgi:predicted PurR-regulated permease PerM